jgi:hypothetical protein
LEIYTDMKWMVCAKINVDEVELCKVQKWTLRDWDLQ